MDNLVWSLARVKPHAPTMLRVFRELDDVVVYVATEYDSVSPKENPEVWADSLRKMCSAFDGRAPEGELRVTLENKKKVREFWDNVETFFSLLFHLESLGYVKDKEVARYYRGVFEAQRLRLGAEEYGYRKTCELHG